MDAISVLNNEPSTSSSQIFARLGMCEVCGSSNAKYTCPKCELKTCCLKCTKIHKKELQCDGVRDKVKFLPLKKFTNFELSSDYRFLEEITRSVEGYKKNHFTKQGRQKHGLPYHLYMLQVAAKERKTILKFLPKNFVRHKGNTTYLKFKENIIHWHIEWIFFNAENFKISESGVPENNRLSHLLHKYVTEQGDPVVQEKLQYYQATSVGDIKIFLKAEQKSGSKFYELDPLLTLKDNLKNKVLVEYPIIHLVLKDHVHLYNVLDSDNDEELDMEFKEETGHSLVNRIIKNSEKEDSIDNSLKNLLFHNENHTDSEMSD